jgi:gliding motility-associated-like protein
VVDNPDVTGESGSTGNGQNIGSVLAQTLTNNSTDAQKVTYTIIPWTVNEHGNNACPGTPLMVDVWIEPTVNLIATGDTICNGATTDIPVTSPNTSTNGIRYTWTVVDNPDVTGESGSVGNGQNIGTMLAQTLTNNSTDAQRVTYTITPWTVNENGNNACAGTPLMVDVWIEPAVTLIATGDTICNGATTDIPVTSPNTSTNGIRYTWTVVDNPDVTGESGSAGNGQNIGTMLAQTLTNNSTDPQKVTYTITPWTINEHWNNVCVGTPLMVDVWVEPTVILIATGDTICSGATTDIPVTSNNTTTSGIRYTWTVADNPDVTGESGSAGTGQNIGTVLAQTLTNNSMDAQRVTYTITSWTVNEHGNNACAGTTLMVDVWVEPTITLIAIQDTICNGGTTDMTVTSNNTTTNGIRYTWTVVDNPDITGETGSVGNGQNIGMVLAQTLTNNSTDAQNVTYTITPWTVNVHGNNACPGTPRILDIWVAPSLRVVVDTISTYIGGKNIRCYGQKNGSIRLMPEGGITAFPSYDVFDLVYTWSNGKVTKDIAGLGQGTYSVIIHDKLNCQDNRSFTLTQPEVLETDIVTVNLLSCQGSDGIIAPLTSGGSINYRYIWKSVPSDYCLAPAPVYQDTLYNVIEGPYTVQTLDTNNCTRLDSIMLSQPLAASIEAHSFDYGNYQIRCHGENSGSWVTINNNETDIHYHWKGPNGFDTTFTNSTRLNYMYNVPSGRYRLDFTDEAGCSNTTFRDMNEPDLLSIDQVTVSEFPGNYNVSCFGSDNGSITLNHISGGHASRGYYFDWTSLSGGIIGDTTRRNQTGLTAGSYSVVVSDTFSCNTSKTFDLVQPEELQMLAEVPESPSGAYNLNCFGDNSGYIILHPQGGDITQGPYQFFWNQAVIPGEMHNLPAGDYIITLKDGIQCSKTDTIWLTQPAKLKVDSTIFSDYNGYEVSCNSGNDGIIHIFASGGEGKYLYTWTSDSGTISEDSSYIDQLNAGTYGLTIQDANTCRTTWNGTLNDPEPMALQMETTNVNCTGTVLGTALVRVTGGIPGYAYSWDSGENTPDMGNHDTGTYIVTVTDRNLCTTSDTAIIGQNPPVQIEIQIVKNISCTLGSDGVIRASVTEGVAPYTYLWNNGTQDSSLTGIQKGNYNVTVTDMDGCSNSQAIVMDDPAPIAANLNITDPSCFRYADGTTELAATGGTGGYSFIWNGARISGTTINQLKAGSYTLRIEDEVGCTHDTMIVITEPGSLLMSLNKNFTVYPFCPDWENGAIAIRVTGGTPQYQYQWIGYPDDTDSILNDIKEDSYAVKVIDSRGCTADSIFRLIALNNSCLGIPTAFTPNFDNANDTWDISYINENGGESSFHEVYPNGVIQIYDRLGNLIYRCTAGCAEAWNGEDMRGRRLPSDSYYYIIELNNGEDQTPLKGIVTIIR